ncbi:phage portal protein [Candidatus Saccharibacteria bacterium]|nr:phage portal protein [Candidatus Saccharibacteria bacterium]MBQ8984331.1 phage portal protein [Candidatus Saccharibacteria bacterium]
MGIRQTIKDYKAFRDATRRSEARAVKQELANQLFVNPLCSDYENVFAQVQPLINDMKMVRPFGVGKNGGRLPIARTPELNLLYTPNEEMGWGEFAGSMFVTWLTEDELNIHVHMDRNRVTGYSILPPGSKVYLGNGRYYFQSNTEDGIENIERDRVMTLRFSRSPKNLQRGISPATAVRAWAQTEDVLAQYERAYIENGAIPASITFIRASTYDKFLATQKDMENSLRGARNKGKTLYIWRQFNNDTGESLDQVEVKTIQGNNSTLAIKELADIINDHLNKAYGVSNFILGDDSSAKYDNAELSDYQFIKRRVYPALTAFWDQFQFELDRITGGLGYAISFELELPDLTERLKVRAETNKIRSETLTELIRAGAPPEATVKALGLSDDWKKVARGISTSVLADLMIESNKKQSDIEHQDKNRSQMSSNCVCHHSQKHSNPVSTIDELPPMDAEEKKIYDILVSMAERIFANTPNIDVDGVIEQISEVLDEKARLGAVEGGEKIIDLLNDEAVVAEIKNTLEELQISGTLKDRIVERTRELVNNYGDETRRIMEEVLAGSEGLSAAEIRKELSAVMPTWQAERIARTETVYAYKSGRLDEDEQVSNKYGLNLKLVWRARHDSKTCPVCAAMDGEVVSVGKAFEHIKETADGTISWEPSVWNDEGRIPAPHPNCRCYFDEIVEAA